MHSSLPTCHAFFNNNSVSDLQLKPDHSHREDTRVSHYIINKIQQSDQMRYKIGDQVFPDLASLLNFYKMHYLDSTPLIRPVPKRNEKVIAKYDFDGNVSVEAEEGRG